MACRSARRGEHPRISLEPSPRRTYVVTRDLERDLSRAEPRAEGWHELFLVTFDVDLDEADVRGRNVDCSQDMRQCVASDSWATLATAHQPRHRVAPRVLVGHQAVLSRSLRERDRGRHHAFQQIPIDRVAERVERHRVRLKCENAGVACERRIDRQGTDPCTNVHEDAARVEERVHQLRRPRLPASVGV